MEKKKLETSNLEILPLTPERWKDCETVFGPNGCYGCWCMWWRMKGREFSNSSKEEHKTALRTIVQNAQEPGLIAYVDGVPAAWVAVAPRDEYVRLKTSRTLFAVDDQPAWVISCFFIHRNYRRLGLMGLLIDAACDFARSKGAGLIEAFPLQVNEKTNSASLFTGVESVFKEHGFVVAATRNNHLILRKTL
mgnify:CR=1 FL=1